MLNIICDLESTTKRDQNHNSGIREFGHTGAKHELFFNKPASEQSMTRIITLAFVNLVTPKAGAKHELLLNKPASELSVTRIITGKRH